MGRSLSPFGSPPAPPPPERHRPPGLSAKLAPVRAPCDSFLARAHTCKHVCVNHLRAQRQLTPALLRTSLALFNYEICLAHLKGGELPTPCPPPSLRHQTLRGCQVPSPRVHLLSSPRPQGNHCLELGIHRFCAHLYTKVCKQCVTLCTLSGLT